MGKYSSFSLYEAKKKDDDEEYTDKDEKGKLDDVNDDELEGSHKEREDGDIDNDGDEDESDKYLHKRRKAIGKSIDKQRGKEEVEEGIIDVAKDKLKKAKKKL